MPLDLYPFCREKDEMLFEKLYLQHKPAMLACAYKMLPHHPHLAEDAVHSVFLWVLQHMSIIKKLSEPALKAYLLKAVRNACISILRREPPQVQPFEDFVPPPNIAETDEVLDQLCAEETYDAILRAIQALPELYADVLSLYYISNLKLVQIAALLQLKYDTAKKRFERGKLLLIQKIMEEKERKL